MEIKAWQSTMQAFWAFCNLKVIATPGIPGVANYCLYIVLSVFVPYTKKVQYGSPMSLFLDCNFKIYDTFKTQRDIPCYLKLLLAVI